MESMFPYNSEHNAMNHWKCVLRCCDKCPSMVIPNQEANRDTPHTYPKIHFHVYINVSHCTMHGIHPNGENTTCCMFSTVASADTTEKIYTQKDIVLLQKYITESHKKFYILAIQKLVFNFTHVHIIGTHNCGKEHRKAFK